MAKDSYLEISSHFGIYPLEQSIALREDKFLKIQFVGQLFMLADSQTLACKFLFFVVVVVLYLLMYFFAYFDVTIKLVK